MQIGLSRINSLIFIFLFFVCLLVVLSLNQAIAYTYGASILIWLSVFLPCKWNVNFCLCSLLHGWYANYTTLSRFVLGKLMLYGVLNTDNRNILSHLFNIYLFIFTTKSTPFQFIPFQLISLNYELFVVFVLLSCLPHSLPLSLSQCFFTSHSIEFATKLLHQSKKQMFAHHKIDTSAL